MRWIQGEDASKDQAKSRLQLILIQDRSSVDPGILEALREDLMAVMASYFDVINDGLDVQFQRDGNSLALVANIPIRTLRGRNESQFSERRRSGGTSFDDEERSGPAAMPTDDSRLDTGGKEDEGAAPE
jgi:cell division topological specificity factor